MSNLSTQVRNGFAWSLIENFSLQGIRFFIGIVMARLLSPTDYGLVGMLTVFIVVSDLLVNSGIGSALNKMQNRKEQDFSTAFLFNFTIGIALYVILFLSSGAIASFYGISQLKMLMQILALSLIINSLCVVPMTKLQISLKFRCISLVTVISAVASGISGIGFAMNGYGVLALVYSTIIGNATRLVLLYIIVKWIPRTGFSYASFKNMFSYGSKLLGGQLIDTLYTNVYPLVIGKVYSATALGFYSRAQGYANLPASTFTMMIYRVCFPAFCKQNNNKKELMSSYSSMMRYVSFCTIFVMMMLLSLAEPLIVVLITDKWISCANMLKVLCLATMWYPILEVNLSAIKALGYSSAVLKMQIINKSFAILVLAFTLQFDIIVMCVGAAIVSAFSVLVNFSISRKILATNMLEQIKPLIAPLLGGAAMYIVISVFTHVTGNPYLQCISGFIAGTAAYVAVTCLLGFPVKEMLGKLFRKKVE